MICIALKHPGGFKQAKGVFQLWSITGLLHQWCAGYLSGHRSLYCIDISARPLQTNWSSECVCLGLLQIYKYIAKSLFILLLNCPVLCSRRCARCVYPSLPPKTEHSDCTFTAVQIGRAGRAPFPSPPGSTRAGARPATADQLQTRASVLHWGWGQEPMFKAASPCTEKSIFSHKTRRGMFGNHSLNERVPVLS